MLTLTEDQVKSLADPALVIHAIRAAFDRDFGATLQMPVRTALQLENGGVLLLMPACDSALHLAGVKTVTVTKAAGVSAQYELLDPSNGAVLARMEANWLTDVRTAATSAVATDLLARADVETLGIFGSGRQARAHLAVLPQVRKFKRFLLCGLAASEPGTFAETINRICKIKVEITDPETCVRQSDVICTCTTSPAPLFDGQWIRPGTHINLIGAFQPETREADDETMRLSRIVVDTYPGALAEAGDLLIPLSKGTITKDAIAGDLHEIASGKRRGRTSPADITVFKSVGCALEDLVTAKLVYERAKA